MAPSSICYVVGPGRVRDKIQMAKSAYRKFAARRMELIDYGNLKLTNGKRPDLASYLVVSSQLEA